MIDTSIVILQTSMTVAAAVARLQAFTDARWTLLRRQAATVEWFALLTAVVRARLAAAAPGHLVGAALDLDPANRVDAFDLLGAGPDGSTGVAMVGSDAVGYVPDSGTMAMGRGAPLDAAAPAPAASPAGAAEPWRADAEIAAPPQVRLGEAFDLTVSLVPPVGRPDVEVHGLALDETTVELDLHVVGAFEIVERIRDRITVDRSTLAHEPARFRLRAAIPPASYDPTTGIGVERVEIRFVHRGVPVGAAWREVFVDVAGDAAPGIGPGSAGGGIRFGDQPQDATIVIARPDANPASGRYAVTLASPHLDGPGRTWPMLLAGGDNPQTFAMRIRALAVSEAQQPQTDDTFLGIGAFVSGQVPPELWESLREIHDAAGGRQPLTVLLVTDDAYIPWELAVMPEPLDPARPGFLGAQVALGRWPHDLDLPDPAPQPAGAIAVIVGHYEDRSRYLPLPGSEQEAGDLRHRHGATLIRARRRAVDALLEGRAGPVDVVHFSGHGDVDQTGGHSSDLILEDGRLNEFALAAADIARQSDVFLFFNACLAGFGHESLGAFAGMAGSAARAGFRGFLAPMWPVADQPARTVALDVYGRAAAGLSLGQCLREVRARFVQIGDRAAHTTYLAYLYYGHPSLRLTDVPAAAATGSG